MVTLPLLFGSILVGILLVFFVVETRRRQAFGRPLLAVAAALIGSSLLAWFGQAIVSLIRSGDYWRGFPWVTEVAVYGSAMAACLLALLLVAPKAGQGPMRAGFWLVFLGAGAVRSAKSMVSASAWSPICCRLRRSSAASSSPAL